MLAATKGREVPAFLRNKMLRIMDYIPESLHAETEYCRDFQSPQKIFYEACISSYYRKNAIAAWGIHRSKTMGDLSENEMKTIDLLLPHFAKAMHKIDMIERERPSGSGTIIINDDGRVLYMDENAKKILKGHSKDISGELIASREFTTETGDRYKVTTEFEGKSLMQKIIHLEHTASPEFGLVSKLADFGLTKRQREIVILVIRGLSNREIAEKLFISEQTAKDHLQDAFEKIGVNRRSKLIAKLLALYPDTH